MCACDRSLRKAMRSRRGLASTIPSLLFLIVLSLALVPPAWAGTLSVPSQLTLASALSTAGDGDVIEIAPGTYVVPAGGLIRANRNGHIVVRPSGAGNVIFEGLGNKPLVRLENSGPVSGSVRFEGITFQNGLSVTDGRSGGVTMKDVRVTFSNCSFKYNRSAAPTTGGGAVFLYGDSTVHVFDSYFEGNTAINEGGAIRVGDDTIAVVHNSEFRENRVNIANHRPSAPGGAIHLTNADVFITNSAFHENEAGCIGGAVYGIAVWQSPISVPRANLWIANSLFDLNVVEPHPSVSCSFATSGGAIHLEDQIHARVHSTRFRINRAGQGGAISMYRAKLDIRNSEFRGNRATGTDSSTGRGGAIDSSSKDINDASTQGGAVNRPATEITIADSYFQGRWGGTGSSALKGGCVFTLGDLNRTYGVAGVSQMGTAAQNREKLTIDRTAFVDCDVQSNGQSGTGTGGALGLTHTQLVMRDSLITGSDALGGIGDGGAMRLLTNSHGTIERSTFAENTAGRQAPALYVFASHLDVSDSAFFANSTAGSAHGSAIWSSTGSVPGGSLLGVSGIVQDTTFSENVGVDIMETDPSGGVTNTMTYLNNDFRKNGASAVYRHPRAPSPVSLNVSQLNSAAPDGVDKAPSNDNAALGSRPTLGALLAVPSVGLANAAVGEASVPARFLAWAWHGSGALLDASNLPNETGSTTTTNGSHTLDVDGTDFIDSVTAKSAPTNQLMPLPLAISSGQSSELSWSTTSGDYLGGSLDRQTLDTTNASGQTTVYPGGTNTYTHYAFTKQGGCTAEATVWVDELPGGTIFEDGFESGNTGAWGSSQGE